MPTKKYSKIYDEKKKEEIEEVKEEAPVKHKKEIIKKAIVIGDANLNVRDTPGGSIITTITPGTEVTIDSEVNEDWYKISKPLIGHIMKKFIEVK